MEKIYENLVTLRHHFHRYPERGWREYWTTSEICRMLEEMGYHIEFGQKLFNPEYRYGLPEQEELDLWYQKALDRGADPKYIETMKGGFCGVVATFDTGREGPVFAFESELDALPGVTDFEKGTEIKERARRPKKEGWKSENDGIMHACGHDVHMTWALGIAHYIISHPEKFSGKYVFFFTPAEEGGQGAKSFADLPIIKEINYYFAYHNAVRALGKFMFSTNTYFRSMEQIIVKYKIENAGLFEMQLLQKLKEQLDGGLISEKVFMEKYIAGLKGSPYIYDNPIRAASNVVQGIELIPARRDGQHLLTVTNMNHSGLEVSFKIFIRCDNNDSARYYSNEVRKLVKAQANYYDLKLEIEECPAWNYPAWEYNDPELRALAVDTWHEIGMGNTEFDIPFGEFGGDDDVFLMNKIKENGGKSFYGLIISDTNGGRYGELHTPKMDTNEEILEIGVKLTTRMMENLSNKGRQEKK